MRTMSADSRQKPFRPVPPVGRAVFAAAALALIGGCAGHRDSVVVGAVPDDYRTNHPIMITEKDEVIDLPVAAGDHRMTEMHRVAVDGFMAAYDRRTGALVRIMVPAGAANTAAATQVARDLASRMHKKGVPSGRVVTLPYEAGASDAAAPIRIAYGRIKAVTDKCGRWPADILDDAENKHYANFGCSYQNNLAAQIANPADLLGPREPGEIDAENRANAIDQYKARGVADDFNGNIEVEY